MFSVKDTFNAMKKINHKLLENMGKIHFHQRTGVQNIKNSLNSAGRKQTVQYKNGQKTHRDVLPNKVCDREISISISFRIEVQYHSHLGLVN